MSQIHATAIIADSAKVASDVVIGPYAIIGENVEIGAKSYIAGHAVIYSNTRMGKNNRVYQFASIGGDNQDLIKDDQPTWLEIGDDNIFHEFTTINRGSVKENGLTKIGSQNLFMAYSHVGHDSIIGDHTIFANGATLAGHVTVDDYVTVGAYCAVHQFCHIGKHSFLARGAMVSQDVLPFLMVTGNDPKVSGLNMVGLKRHGFDKEALSLAQQVNKIIFRDNLTLEEALAQLKSLDDDHHGIVTDTIHAIERANRGIVR